MWSAGSGFRIYGLTDAVEEGVTGLMHPPGSVAEIVTALEKLLQDEYLRGEWATLRVKER